MINDSNNEKKEEQLIEKKKKSNIVFIILVLLLVSIIVTLLLLLFLLKGPKYNEEEEITILPPLIFNSTSGKHTHTIIYMPGFSSTPEDYNKTFTNKIIFDKKSDTNIIILRSPLTYCTAVKSKNYSWFDIYNFPIRNYSDCNFEDIKKSAKILEKVIDNEVNILNGKYENIIIGGHSQGATVSLYLGYNTKKNLGGLFAFSGVLPPGEISKNKNNFKVYYGYGDKDNVINPNFMLESIERVRNFKGFNLHLYENHTHHVNSKEKSDASEFLNNIIK